MLNLSKMEYKENRYNLADISSISESSSCTVREQVSQLGLDIKGCLHSTFNYPLHSTINFVDITMNFSENSACSKTLVDSADNTLVKLNENLRASDIKDSTVMSKGSKNASSDSTEIKKDNKSVNSRNSLSSTMKSTEQTQVLLPDQSYPTQSSLQSVLSHQLSTNNNDEDTLFLDYDSDSDCDSSCMSFDVDDVSICIDDEPISSTVNHKSEQPDNKYKNCYINHMIHNHVGAQMWGNDYTRSVTSVTADCDVCKLMKMKRQRACTDLWSGPHGPFDDPSSLVSTVMQGKSSIMSSVNSSSTTNSTRSVGNKRLRNNHEDKPHGLSKRRNTLSSNTFSPSVSITKKARRPSKTSARKIKTINAELGSRESFLRKSGSDIGERLHPEGMEDDKENCHPSVTTIWSDSCNSMSRLHSISENDSGFSSTNNSMKSRGNISGQSNVSSQKQFKYDIPLKGYTNRVKKSPYELEGISQLSNNVNSSTPSMCSSRKSRSRRSLKQSSQFCDSIPTPSPWKGDKKLIKKKLKELSLNLEGQSNIQTLGCF